MMRKAIEHGRPSVIVQNHVSLRKVQPDVQIHLL